jgi:hypothetical protein
MSNQDKMKLLKEGGYTPLTKMIVVGISRMQSAFALAIGDVLGTDVENSIETCGYDPDKWGELIKDRVAEHFESMGGFPDE